MAKTNLKVRTKKCYEDSCVRYVIIYTNDKTVQGHCIYCFVSIVNILLQGKVQRVTPTGYLSYAGFNRCTLMMPFFNQNWAGA